MPSPFRPANELMVQYAAYHRDRRNIATHFVGIPLIVFAIGIFLARAQFDAGLVDFTDVLNAQGALLTNRNTLAQSDALLLTDLSRLYKALGGGWEPVPKS